MDETLRADELLPGMVAEFEDFAFTVMRVKELTDNWLLITPYPGVPMHIERYEQIKIIRIPQWVERERQWIERERNNAND